MLQQNVCEEQTKSLYFCLLAVWLLMKYVSDALYGHSLPSVLYKTLIFTNTVEHVIPMISINNLYFIATLTLTFFLLTQPWAPLTGSHAFVQHYNI